LFRLWIIPRLGNKTISRYLDDFSYGNHDFSSGEKLTLQEAVLKISPLEQASFLKRLWNDELPISKHAQELTRKILFIKEANSQGQLYGKTGSCCIDKGCESKPGKQLAWFVGALTNRHNKYVFVTNFSDLEISKGYAGGKAREITEAILGKLGITR